MEHKIRIIPHMVSERAAYSLAIDRALHHQMEEDLAAGKAVVPILRTYQFAKPVVILGYNELPNVNHSMIEEMECDLTVRDTGGGHMYFSPNDIHYSFISPDANFSVDPMVNYERVNTFIAIALQRLGYDAALGRTSIRHKEREGRLLAGTAQKKTKNSFLLQGGILVDEYPREAFDMMNASPEERFVWNSKVTNINQIGSGNIYRMPVELAKMFSTHAIQPLTESEIRLAEKYLASHYDNKAHIMSGTKEGKICLIAGSLSTKGIQQETEA